MANSVADDPTTQLPPNNLLLSVTAAAAVGPSAVGIIFIRVIAIRVGRRSCKTRVLVHDPDPLFLDVLTAGRRRIRWRDNGNRQQRCRKYREYQKPDREFRHAFLLLGNQPHGMHTADEAIFLSAGFAGLPATPFSAACRRHPV
jgi:hypothetical protein